MLWFDAVPYAVKHLVDNIQVRSRPHRIRLASMLALPLAQHVENILSPMADFDQGLDTEEACSSLDGMETTKYPHSAGHSLPAAAPDPPAARSAAPESLVPLATPILQYFIIYIDRHALLPKPADTFKKLSLVPHAWCVWQLYAELKSEA